MSIGEMQTCLKYTYAGHILLELSNSTSYNISYLYKNRCDDKAAANHMDGSLLNNCSVLSLTLYFIFFGANTVFDYVECIISF